MIELSFLNNSELLKDSYVIWKHFQKCHIKKTIQLTFLDSSMIWEDQENKEHFIKMVMKITGLKHYEQKSKRRRKKLMNIFIFQKKILNENLKLLIEIEISKKQMIIKWYRSLIHDLINKKEINDLTSIESFNIGNIEQTVINKLSYYSNEIPLEILNLEIQFEQIIYDYNSNHLMRQILINKDFKLFKKMVNEKPKENDEFLEFKPYIKKTKSYKNMV